MSQPTPTASSLEPAPETDSLAMKAALAGVSSAFASLFGPEGTLRRLLLAGEQREGWHATLEVPGSSPRAVSVTAAPFCPEPGAVCDPRVAFVVVLRPAEEDQHMAGSPSPG